MYGCLHWGIPGIPTTAPGTLEEIKLCRREHGGRIVRLSSVARSNATSFRESGISFALAGVSVWHQRSRGRSNTQSLRIIWPCPADSWLMGCELPRYAGWAGGIGALGSEARALPRTPTQHSLAGQALHCATCLGAVTILVASMKPAIIGHAHGPRQVNFGVFILVMP